MASYKVIFNIGMLGPLFCMCLTTNTKPAVSVYQQIPINGHNGPIFDTALFTFKVKNLVGRTALCYLNIGSFYKVYLGHILCP